MCLKRAGHNWVTEHRCELRPRQKRWGQSCGPRMQEHRACPQDGWWSCPLVAWKAGWDHHEAAREQIRKCLVNLEIRLDSASQWFSHYLLVLQINALGRLHKHFIPISSLGIFFASLKLVKPKKYLHPQIFCIPSFITLTVLPKPDEHVLVQTTEESICHCCKYSRTSYKCVIVWEGGASSMESCPYKAGT